MYLVSFTTMLLCTFLPKTYKSVTKKWYFHKTLQKMYTATACSLSGFYSSFLLLFEGPDWGWFCCRQCPEQKYKCEKPLSGLETFLWLGFKLLCKVSQNVFIAGDAQKPGRNLSPPFAPLPMLWWFSNSREQHSFCPMSTHYTCYWCWPSVAHQVPC